MRAEDIINQKLDEVLEMTFPASDPFTIDIRESGRDDEHALAVHECGLESAA